jgi:hypothetical protein
MEMILLVATLAASAVIGVVSLQLPQLAADPGGPGLFPLAMAVMTGGACVLLIGQKLLAPAQGSAAAGRAGTAQRIRETVTANARQLGVIVLVLVFPLGIEWIGFTPAVLLFTFLTLWVSGKSLLTTGVTSALITAGVYVAYVLVLGAVLPQGELVYRLLH